MSGNSSDSESSCGWTIINHEGSDIETLHSEPEPTSDHTFLKHSPTFVENLQPDSPEELPDICRNEDILNVENIHSTLEEHQLLATEDLPSFSTCKKVEHSQTCGECCDEDSVLGNEGHCEAVSDDSDIATLEPPKVDEVGSLEEEQIQENMTGNTDMNMSFSSSSQYAFTQPGTVFPSEHSADNSSNDEASDYSGPVLRPRRSKRSTMSGSECETKTSADPPLPPEPRAFLRLGSSLNKCIVLSLLIAISMGFGHFYGTIQILERQKYVEMIYENELNDMKDDLFQCQKHQEATMEGKSGEDLERHTEDLEHRRDMVLSLEGLMDKITEENKMLKEQHTELKVEADGLASSLKTTVAQNKDLALENQHLRDSLEKEEQALLSLKEELRKLREQIRHLDKKERHDIVLTENQKLKEHMKEERQKLRSFRAQKEILLSEAQLLRNKLEEERQITDSLKMELEEISNQRSASETYDSNLEIEHLKERLLELEKKLNFEQQRSDLWERLYVEAKEQKEKAETGNRHTHQDQSSDENAKDKTKKKAKDTFFNSVKDTFDAMKNSTKEFVRHHKEKIKQAKEAVKENLKKFSDSVKTTFRHFKDSTKSMFDKNRYRKHAEKRREESKEAHTVRREYKPDTPTQYPDEATDSQQIHKDQSDENHEVFEDKQNWQFNGAGKSSAHLFTNKKGCSGVFDCAHQESLSLFNKVVDPVRVEEFHDLMHIYLQEQVDHFQHWKELEQFINRFFPNGIFIHDQMLFTDFVKDVEDYLEDMKQYQTNSRGVFEDLDEFVYRHFFGSGYSAPYGPRKPENTQPSKDPERKYRKQEDKYQSRYKRECKWHKNGRANGRHMANFEIELGQLPLDPKY